MPVQNQNANQIFANAHVRLVNILDDWGKIIVPPCFSNDWGLVIDAPCVTFDWGLITDPVC